MEGQRVDYGQDPASRVLENRSSDHSVFHQMAMGSEGFKANPGLNSAQKDSGQSIQWGKNMGTTEGSSSKTHDPTNGGSFGVMSNKVNSSSVAPTAGNGEGGRHRFFEKTKGFHSITYPELLERRAKGLCFKCGEKFHPLHQCVEKQLRLLVLEENETLNADGEIINIEAKHVEEEES